MNDILNKKIGTKTSKLEAKPVVIMGITSEEVGADKSLKAVFMCKHPDKEEAINISSIVYQAMVNGEEIPKSSGTWINLDADGLLKMDSLLAQFIARYGAETVMDMEGRTVTTTLDSNGFICFDY